LLLKKLREERGLSQHQLAKLSHVARPYITRTEKGKGAKNPTLKTIKAWARALGVPVEVFLRDIETQYPTLTDLLKGIEVTIKAYIPVYAEVSAGEGIEPIDYVACTRNKAAPESLKAYRVKGLCLEPDIKDGDTVIVDTALEPQNGDLVICIINNEASVKRFRETDSGKYLETNHNRIQPENVHIHGVVIEVNRKMR